jgi:hypothetical protein
MFEANVLETWHPGRRHKVSYRKMEEGTGPRVTKKEMGQPGFKHQNRAGHGGSCL